MDSIIESIYKSCDENHTNSVCVSSLIEFIKPYMPNNLSELVELRSQLDPDNTNPNVSFSTFHAAMGDWIAKIKAEDVNNSLELSFSQSFSSQSKPINNNVVDPVLEEQICCLKYQLSRTTAELEMVKQHLVASEEQNEALLAELKAKSKPQQRDEPSVKQTSNDESQEEESSYTAELIQLRKMLSISEKQQEMYLSQIKQLENENLTLKAKEQNLEKVKKESRRSISEMHDVVDEKDTEISTLTEIISDLKCQLEEKTDRMNFYMNEHKLLKQRTHELETVLENNTCQIFNTPRLVRQIANPVTPLNMKEFDTSSPIHNTSQNSSDFFTHDVVTVLRSPRKSLKDELSEVSTSPNLRSPKISDNDEVKRLLKVIKEQEHVKNGLWQTMKVLDNENKTLLSEKENQKSGAQQLLLQLTDMGNNLNRQKLMNRNLQENIQALDEILNQQVSELAEKLKVAEAKLRKEKAKHLKKLSCDQSTETEIYVSQQTDPKRTNFARQQMKMERILEKQEKVERELATERAINTKLEQKCKETGTENTKLSENLKICENKVREQAENINELLGEKKSLIGKIEVLEKDKTLLQSEMSRVKENLCNALETVNHSKEQLCKAFEKISTLQSENGVLLNKQCLFDQKMKEEIIKNKHLVDSCVINNLRMKELQNELIEKSNEIRNLKKQIEVGNVEFLISEYNEELKSAILNLVNDIKFGDDIVKGMAKTKNKDSLMNLENEITTLKSNIKSVILLLQKLSKKYLDLTSQVRVLEEKSQLSCNESDVSAFEEDSFVSCSSDISLIQEQFTDIIALERDSFLESMNLGDLSLRNLSRKEMEEKFTTLALLLTVDSKTARKRWICEEKRFNNLVAKFFAYLNYCIEILKMNETSKIHQTTVRYLQLMKDVTEEMLKSAADCGVLHFEKRTATCWNFVTNYVAILSQENEQMKNREGSIESKLIKKPTYSSSTVLKRIGRFFCNFLIFFIIFVIVLLFYIEKECPKDGKRTCPMQWIKNLFIERIPSHNMHL